MQHIFIVGAKGYKYGGYETFLDKLTEYHQNNKNLQYHIACKANGDGVTDETTLDNVKIISKSEYIYHNAHCFKIKALKCGAAQAIIYDIKSLMYCCQYIKKNHIQYPIVYVLSSRIGPVIGYFAKVIHKSGGIYMNNPDGLEFKRKKYSMLVRAYWKLSEQKMIKYSDLIICDSRSIEQYINKEYKKYKPNTTYIAYGSDITPSLISDNDLIYKDWLRQFGLRDKKFYCSVGRFVPENNFEIMIREFMNSKTDKDFVIITTKNDKFLMKLDKKLCFSKDKRIKFVGAIYNQALLKKIRENAYGYFHGHEVGGTNPSLLEALGATKINLLLDVSFNREVAGNAALYWTKQKGDLKQLIESADLLNEKEIENLRKKAQRRILNHYTWDHISTQYLQQFTEAYKRSQTERK